jgi:tetratricopeptide (TPR) repeat protein
MLINSFGIYLEAFFEECDTLESKLLAIAAEFSLRFRIDRTMPPILINPYKVGPPVAGGDFYGRSKLLVRVYQALQQSNVVLLQGQRRIGKTSFLKHLAAYVDTLPLSSGAIALVPVLFDIQRYVQDTLPQFQRHLAEAMRSAVVNFTPDRSVELTVPGLAEWEADHTLFRDRWLPLVYEQLGERAIVFLVDEFDNLEGEAVSLAMQTLIPFLGQLVTGELALKWVLTLGRHSGKLPIQYEPIVSVGKQFHISFLSPSEVQQLLTKPVAETLTYEDEAIDRICQLTGGQPHLTQAIGSELWQSVVLDQERDRVTVAEVDGVIPGVLETYSSSIASIVRVPPVEERVLAAVAQLTGVGKATDRDAVIRLLIENRVQISSDELRTAIDSLIQWELLKGSTQEVRVPVELERLWVIQNLSVEPTREETLDIQSALAESRFEFAEKARRSGHYDLAFKDYQETLKYLPNHVGSLRGLAELGRLCDDFKQRITALEALCQFDRGVANELMTVRAEYAQNLEQSNHFFEAADQYRALLKVQNHESFLMGFRRNLVNSLQKDLRDSEDSLKKMFVAKSYQRDDLLRLKEKFSRIKQTIQGVLSQSARAEHKYLSNIFDEAERLENMIEQAIYVFEKRRDLDYELRFIKIGLGRNLKKADMLLVELTSSDFELSEEEVKAVETISENNFRLIAEYEEAIGVFEKHWSSYSYRPSSSLSMVEIDRAKREIKDGLAVEFDSPANHSFKSRLLQLERREWIIRKRVQLVEAKKINDRRQVSAVLLELKEHNVKLETGEKSILKSEIDSMFNILSLITSYAFTLTLLFSLSPETAYFLLIITFMLLSILIFCLPSVQHTRPGVFIARQIDRFFTIIFASMSLILKGVKVALTPIFVILKPILLRLNELAPQLGELILKLRISIGNRK